MNIASLELCKTLYELSGWDETFLKWYEFVGYDFGLYSEPLVSNKSNNYRQKEGMYICPAYDLGYLLRKLGNLHVELKRPYINSEPINLWSCTAMYDDGEELPAYLIESADTPEDAACSLCVELFRKDVLKREGEQSAHPMSKDRGLFLPFNQSVDLFNVPKCVEQWDG